MMNKLQYTRLFAALVAACGVHGAVQAQQRIEDKLTDESVKSRWKPLNGACLTAGNNTGPIPACVGLPYYNGKTLVGGNGGELPDPIGKGALRLTNGDTQEGGSNGDNQTGAVVSDFTFPTDQGVKISFTTVTYGGDNLDGHGADGISFFLSDGEKLPTVGALGGSMGYTCSNINGTNDGGYDGVRGAYLGIGIDEFGNFSNPGDNTDTGPGFKAGRISVRGGGDTAWASLNEKYKRYYPDGMSKADKAEAVRNTCKTGYLWNYSGGTLRDAKGTRVNNKRQTGERLPYNYPLIAYRDLGISIANQQRVKGDSAPIRENAVKIAYSVRITKNGLLDFSYRTRDSAPQQVLSNMRITDSNGPLPLSFRFGFSSGTGGGNNVHEITCFKATPVEESQSSAVSNLQPSGRADDGTQVYLAYYHSDNWWGQLTAQRLIDKGNTIVIEPAARWDASCTLTGGSCPTMGVDSSNNAPVVAAQDPDARKIVTWNGSSGSPLRWDDFTLSQKASLTAGDSSVSGDRVAYLRGDRSNEISGSGGKFRTRTGVLGDIVDSSPTSVGGPSSPYTHPWIDALHPSAKPAEPAGSYQSFKTKNASRQNLVYVGSNDGFLHAFRAGAYDADGKFVSNTETPNDGTEAFAYMPAAVLSSIHSTVNSLDYSHPQYSHNLYVNATPGTGDLFYKGEWHTWLVGGLGAGGKPDGPVADLKTSTGGTLFALDITSPKEFIDEDAISKFVLGEWSSSSLPCAHEKAETACGKYLGSTYGTPVIRRLHDGSWGVLFGNGLNSANGTAGLFIMLVNPSDGTKTFRYIDTKRGPDGDPLSGGAKNGIAYVTPADLDGDHITDYVYAGDVFGNVWRFDLTSTKPADWAVRETPVFSTPVRPPSVTPGPSTKQPITSKVMVAALPGASPGEPPRVLVSFGTGQQLPETQIAAAQYARGQQALYGVWDWDMKSWNNKTAGSPYLSLDSSKTITVSDLQTQNVIATAPGSGTVSGYRTVSRKEFCWKGPDSTCAPGADKYGWTLPLPAINVESNSYEQVIYNPVIAYDMFIVNTTIPGSSDDINCESKPTSGYTMAVSMAGGGAASQSFFANAQNEFVNYNGNAISGLGLGATGTPFIVLTSEKNPVMITQTIQGKGESRNINPPFGKGGRLNWLKLR